MSLPQTLQSAVDPQRLRDHLEWFAGVRRDTGGPGEEAAARYISEQLEAAGVKVRVHEFPAFLSYPRTARLALPDTEVEFSCVTHSFTKPTPPDGITGEINYIPSGDLSGAAGKILLLDGLCTPITVLEASKAGVRAIVFANQGDVVHNMIATTIWGTPSVDQLDRLPTVHVVSIAKPDGDDLKARLEAGPVTVHMTTEVETGWYTSKLPEAVIEGSDPTTDEFILVGGHYCSWEFGVTDNATGDACLLEMARILQANHDQLRRSVRLCWWPGHSHGRYSGSTWYADTFFHELAENCVVYHNIDSPGVRNATMYVARHTTAEVEGFCTDLIGSMTGQTEPPVHRPSRAADQSFLANGVPAFSTYPFLPDGHPERKPWTGGCANAWWWHSSADTLDKADVDILAQDTKISLTGVARLANAALLPIDPSRSAQEILDYAQEFEEATRGHINAGRLVEEAQALIKATQDLTDLAGRAEAKEDEVLLENINRTLLKISRVLLPVTYSKGGRYTHDPAEWSPIMRNTKSSVFPGLNPGFALKDLKNEHAYGFVHAGVVRQLNRMIDALRDAAQLCQGVTTPRTEVTAV